MAKFDNTRGARSSHPLYEMWRGMKARCDRKINKDYSAYGGRGIKVCDSWYEFWNFVDDMGEKPSKTHSIDRIDNEKGYHPDNCKWSSVIEQSSNRRDLVNIPPRILGVNLNRRENIYGVTMQLNKKRRRDRVGDFFEACCIRKSWENISSDNW